MGTRGIFEGKYRDISDDSPGEVVRKIQGQYPGVGRKMLKGHPKSQGLTLQRERTGLSLLRLDPTAVLQDGLTRFAAEFTLCHVLKHKYTKSRKCKQHTVINTLKLTFEVL